MDDAFANLEDISDAQALERLETLFDTSSFPNVIAKFFHTSRNVYTL